MKNQLPPAHGRPSGTLSILWLFEGDDTFGRHSGSSLSAKTELRHHESHFFSQPCSSSHSAKRSIQ